ncbi:30S ribosomal protein S20 [Candidatus Uhrbacteria bacterium]|nr:30S ribosomal protein S20 [Candidatus Uhrbacteria bacterium]
MPNKANAWKALRQSEKRAARNTGIHEGISYLRRQYQKSIAAKDAAIATTAFRALQRALDRAAGKGILKANTVSRLKSRAMEKLQKLG